MIGVKTLSWAWYLTKILLPGQRRLIVIAYFLLVNLSTKCKYSTTERICMQISRNIVNGPKSHNYCRFWWESGLSSASRNHLTTFCRSFFHYTCSRLCSVILHFIRSNCLSFVCCGWAAQVLTALVCVSSRAGWELDSQVVFRQPFVIQHVRTWLLSCETWNFSFFIFFHHYIIN